MERVNLTLEKETFLKLKRYSKNAKKPCATAARALLVESLERHEAVARRRALAADYTKGRGDARALLADFEAGQLELLDDEAD